MFGESDELESEIPLQPDYPGLADATFDLDPEGHSTTPTLPRAVLATTAINDGSKCNKIWVRFEAGPV